ncbi:MAG: hypothetical protein R2747_18030 [Pyrinomonadaceae bacterium]
MKTLWDQFVPAEAPEKRSGRVFEMLREKYSEDHRFYHNLDHIGALLGYFGEYRNLIEDPSAVFFSVWFHDAVYDPQRIDNEKKSAELAGEQLAKLLVAEGSIRKISRMILATEKHSAEDLDADGRLFLDFDLAVLGAEKEVYRRYSFGVRREYSFVEETQYRAARGRVLRKFLERDALYLTDPLRRRFEKKARENIEEEIEELLS